MISNIFTCTMSRFKINQPITDITHHSKKELNSSLFKSIRMTVFEVIQKYQLLEKK
jgi:hypothetical protein